MQRLKQVSPDIRVQVLFFVGKAFVELAENGKMTRSVFCLFDNGKGIFIISLNPSLSTMGVKFINKIKLRTKWWFC